MKSSLISSYLGYSLCTAFLTLKIISACIVARAVTNFLALLDQKEDVMSGKAVTLLSCACRIEFMVSIT
jgi:hypothetical protein